MKKLLPAVLCLVVSFSAMAASPDRWAGFYLGGNLGEATGNANWSGIVVPSDTGQNFAPSFADYGLSGASGGIQGGYNFPRGNWLFGVEGRLDAPDARGGQTCFGSPSYGDYSAECKTKIDALGDLSLRLGYIVDNQWLLYLRGGVAYDTSKITPEMHYSTSYLTNKQHRTGGVFGFGVDYAVSNKVSVGVDYSHYDFRNKRTNFIAQDNTDSITPDFSASVKQKLDLVSLRFDYRFL